MSEQLSPLVGLFFETVDLFRKKLMTGNVPLAEVTCRLVSFDPSHPGRSGGQFVHLDNPSGRAGAAFSETVAQRRESDVFYFVTIPRNLADFQAMIEKTLETVPSNRELGLSNCVVFRSSALGKAAGSVFADTVLESGLDPRVNHYYMPFMDLIVPNLAGHAMRHPNDKIDIQLGDGEYGEYYGHVLASGRSFHAIRSTLLSGDEWISGLGRSMLSAHDVVDQQWCAFSMVRFQGVLRITGRTKPIPRWATFQKDFSTISTVIDIPRRDVLYHGA